MAISVGRPVAGQRLGATPALAIIGFGVALLVAFRRVGAAATRRRTRRPQVDRRPVTVALFAGVVIALAQSVPMLILPHYFAIVPRFGPVFGMLAVAPLIAALVVAGPVAGFLLSRASRRGCWSAAGLVIVGLGNVWSRYRRARDLVRAVHPAARC